MTRKTFLPRILHVSLDGFAPVFDRSVSFELQTGPNVILGGNGLGKTTLMQALVFGLTGGMRREAELEKRLRWSHKYFRGRAATNAVVEVDYALDRKRCSIRRTLRASGVAAFRSDSAEWVFEAEAERLFEKTLREAGFQSPNEFAFIVNRLLYLPESRRLLAWDGEAQIRLLMALVGADAQEERFRYRRAELKRLDSAKRHVHVELGKITAEIQRESAPAKLQPSPPRPAALLVGRLKAITENQSGLVGRLQRLNSDLSEISDEVEQLREQIEVIEAGLVESAISETDATRSLAIRSLVTYGTCPACGTKQATLQRRAKENASKHRCELCGEGKVVLAEKSAALGELRAALATKLSEQGKLASRLASFREREATLASAALDTRRNLMTAIAEPAERATPLRVRPLSEEARIRQIQLEREEADLQLQVDELGRALETEYQTFRGQIAESVRLLGELYSMYASRFLGTECTLTETAASDRFLNLAQFVPRFDGAARPTPESCSEAQRFFLDIAFRLAVLDLARNLSGVPASFICETPESALDLSYRDNVVSMFLEFARQGHTLILTTNVQESTIATDLLREFTPASRKRRTLNLLELGRPTKVQRRAMPRLVEAVREVFKSGKR